MTSDLRVSMLQMTSGNRHAVNQVTVDEAAHRAAADGCHLLALPEAAGLMNKDKEDARRQITTEAEDPFLLTCRGLAARYGLWIQPGSTPVKAADGRYLNHGTLIDPSGAIVARYDKVHLFDVFLEGRKPTGESDRYAPGTEAVLVDTPWGPWGLSICYDLRFPHLYRDYAKAGATVLFIPSAFTVPTGRAHWEVLLRARAIENGAYVVAAAQVGDHEDGRTTWGHSLIIDPWGEVMADLGGDTPGQISVTLDIARVAAARQQIPSLENERDYTFTRISAHETASA
ncbi:carbon-nitrogen hydrolase family protein [Boseongicola sp. H5]|uniref:carbon-nitrogen hydrolase family protein n=1 Tax=Boseongicola sp. H5 TaxID=2763261 RepID=UPI001D0B9EAB|nr:carbon-nitrogen hydrolase family protein [Boseongicola sp. H5]